MAFPAEETQHDKEVAALKRAKLKLETELDSERNEGFKLKERVRELELDVRDGMARAQQEAAKAVKAEDALRKRTDAYNTLKDQKANAEMALREAEETCKTQQGELKRLNYQLEVTAAHAAVPSKVVEEKAALEKRVHALTTELQRTQMDLEREKENKAVAAEPAKAAASKIARPASRQSISAIDSKSGPTTRSRFGYQSNIPGPSSSLPKSTRPPSVLGSNAPTRPPSSLSTHTAIPKPGAPRRASVTADAPAGVPAQKLAQLEADLISARSSISTLEMSLGVAESRAADLEASLETTQAKLRAKGDELLRAENALMALQRSSTDEAAQLRSDLEDARDELEGTRDELRREMADLAKEAREEQRALEDEVKRLREAAQRRAEAQEQDDGSREELERLLVEAREDAAELREDVQDLEHELAWHEEQLLGLEALKAEKEALAQELEQLDDEHAECEQVLADKDAALDEIEADMATLSSQIAALQAEKVDLEARLAEEADSPATREMGSSAAAVEEAMQEKEREMEERVGAVQRELEEQIAAVETERDELVVALATASRAHQDAEAQLAERTEAEQQVRVEKEVLERELEAIRQALIEASSASNNLRAESSDSCSTTESLSSKIAALEAQLAEKDARLDDLAVESSQLRSRAAERDDLLAQVDLLTDKLADKANGINELCARVDELEDFAAAAASNGERASSAQLDLEARLASVEAERDEHASTARAGEERLSGLASIEDDFAATQKRVNELEAALEAAQAQLRDEQTLAATSDAAQEQVAALALQVEKLETAVASERALAVAAKEDTTAVEEALMDTKAQLTTTEQRLAAERAARSAAKLECDALYAQISELEHSAARLEHVEQELFAVAAELDDVRANAEDASLAALEDISELQARLREQEAVVDQLERQVVETDALRHILGETEARLDSLGWELRHSQAAALGSEKATEEKVRALLERAEAAEAAVDQLRAELDDARHRLSDAQDSLDQAQADLAVSTSSRNGTPAPASPVPSTLAPATPLNRAFAFSPESDPTVLILRLREERDDLRSRLDFSRTEAKYRVEMLQDRLRVAEESKAAELSTLNLDLMDKQAAYEAECESNAKMEQTLREARREKEGVEERLDEVARRLKDAEGRVADAARRLAEEQKVRDEEHAGRESAWALEGELEAATRSADSARAELEAATAANDELRVTLASIQAELDAALREVEQHQANAAAAGDRIDELEQALLAAQHEREVEQGNKLDDFASLCETLRSDVAGLEDQISTQSSTISAYESRIALLQLNLAVRVAIEDDEDIVDAPVAAEQAEETPAVDVDHLQQDLAAALDARAQLEQQLAMLRAELEDVVERAERATASAGSLDREVVLMRAEAAARQEQLEVAAATAAALEGDVATASATAETAQAHLAELEAFSAEAHDRILELETQLASAHEEMEAAQADAQTREAQEQRLVELQNAHDAAESALAVALGDIASLQSRLTASTADLATTKENLETATASLTTLREQTESASGSSAVLEEQVAQLQATVERMQLDVDEKAVLHEQAQQRVALLEEQLAASRDELQSAVDSRGALEESARAAQDEVVSLSAKLEDASRATAQVSTLEEQLRETRIELESLDALILQERSTAQAAQASFEQAQTAVEHSAREIQTLRQLSASSQAEAAALSEELNGMRSQVGTLTEAVQVLEARLYETSEQSRKNIEEVIDALQTCEHDKAVAEEQVQQLVREVESLKSSVGSSQPSAKVEARMAELEKLLQEKMVDVEEADEKLIEALKVQKRSAAQIERLKAKIATLQRDLSAAKSASIIAAAPLPSAPAPPSIGKKRPAPTEFDAAPVAAPRAIAVPLDKENADAPSSVRRQARPLSAKPASKDAFVPLKPEHVAAAPRRAALGTVDENAGVPALAEKAAPPPASKVDSLRAKMMRMKTAQAGSILKNMSISGQNTSLLTTGVFGSIKCGLSIVWAFFLVETMGRRKMLMLGAVGASISMAVIAGITGVVNPVAHPTDSVPPSGIASLAFLYVWTVFYAVSWNGTPWVVVAESFSGSIQSVVQVFGAGSNWLWNFVIACDADHCRSFTFSEQGTG
ncbi:hypothetical protein JCM10449v2_007675 [Rhodotorula kratochvilovae]